MLLHITYFGFPSNTRKVPSIPPMNPGRWYFSSILWEVSHIFSTVGRWSTCGLRTLLTARANLKPTILIFFQFFYIPLLLLVKCSACWTLRHPPNYGPYPLEMAPCYNVQPKTHNIQRAKWPTRRRFWYQFIFYDNTLINKQTNALTSLTKQFSKMANSLLAIPEGS